MTTRATAFVIAAGLLLIAVVLSGTLVVTRKRLRTARLDAELQAMTQPPHSVER